MAFTGLIYFCILGLVLGLGSVALVLVLHVSGRDLGLGLDISGLVNIPAFALLYYSSIAPPHHNRFTALFPEPPG